MMYLLTTFSSSEPLTYLNSQGVEKLRARAWLISAILVDFNHLQRRGGATGRARDPNGPQNPAALTQTKVT